MIDEELHRAREYEWLAAGALGSPASVRFTDDLGSIGDAPVLGRIGRSEEGLQIEIKRSLSLSSERSVVAHEIAHGRLGHVFVRSASQQAHDAFLLHFVTSPDFTAAAGFDGTKIYHDEVCDKEREAEVVGRWLFSLWWPSSEYGVDFAYREEK